MEPSTVVCPRCGQQAEPGTRQCARCGGPLDPAPLAEVHRLYYTLLDLDRRIAAGQGGQTVAELREEYLARYLALLAASGAKPGVGPAPSVPTTPLSSLSAAALSAAPVTPAAPAVPTVPVQRGAAPLRPPRPAFSWQAFLAEQAIAIMSYLGGFLLLVATATFEVGGWQVLPNLIKLAVVCVVYLLFGGLGFALRRSTRLATVGGAYLGVFALMTPLVALAIYRFQLQASGFPASGMLCVASLYATLVYLALGLRTRFVTYTYLGWVTLVVAALAIVPWSGAPNVWYVFALALAALLLLTPRWMRRFEIGEVLGPAATHVAAVASLAAAFGVEVLVILLAELFIGDGIAPLVSTTAVMAAACVLVPLAAGWSVTLRKWPLPGGAGVIDTVDVLGGAFAAQAAFTITAGLSATQQQLAYVFAGLALAELAAAYALRWRRPSRVTVRRGIEGLALALASLGTLVVIGAPAPNLPLAAALTAGVLVGVGIAIAENAPWWLLAAGFFLTLDYQTVGSAILPPSHLAQNSSAAYAGLSLALWLVALALGLRERTHRFALPLFVVALGDALYTSLLLIYHPDSVYQTVVLLVFMVASFIAARRERRPIWGSIPVGVFGVLAALPFVLDDNTGWHASILAVVLALAALAVRRTQGRVWALAPYVSALVAAILAIVDANAPGVSTAGWQPLGVPWATWLSLLSATLAAVAALWEAWPWTMAVPALFALWAVVITGDGLANLGLVFVIAGAGAAARQWRGRWWGTALYVAALCGSMVVVLHLNDYGAAAPDWQVSLLLGYALATYLIAAHERQPWLTAVAVGYALAAVWLLPGPTNVVPTLALTFGLAAIGVALRFALRTRAGQGWALAPYAAAVGASVFGALRVAPYGAGWLETLLLVLAAAAYVIAYLEGEPRAAGAPIAYAAAGALVQPDAHALLPLALALAVGGLVVGRVAGIRWSYPFYAASTVAAAATAVLGQSNSTFETLALLALAIAAYVIAAVESRPDVLPLALTLGVLALVAGSGAMGLTNWQATLAFAALGWLYALGTLLWRVVPGLRPNGPIWWTAGIKDSGRKLRWGDGRYAGIQVHRWAAILVSGGAVVGALVAPGAFTVHAAQTQVVAVTLLSFAGMLALLGRDPTFHLALYGAGELVALAISWETRWLGADNVQAFVVAPGSYQLLIGALFPADQRVPQAARLGQAASLMGSLVLVLPTLLQSFQADPSWVYALVLAVEALAITGVGVGTHSRLLVLTGSAFVVLAAIRAAILAVQSGLPIPLVIGVLAVLLMGAATWLSLRARRDAAHTTHRT